MFEPFKHHLDFMADKVLDFSSLCNGEEVLRERILTFGRMGHTDIYEGSLSPEDIQREIESFLMKKDIQNSRDYGEFLKTEGDHKRRGHYYLLELSDESEFVLRWAEGEEDFVHIHPGRYVEHTFRTRVNTLKSALAAHYLSLRQNRPINLEVLLEARQLIDLSPLPEIPSAIDEMIERLQVPIDKKLERNEKRESQ